MIKMIEDLYLTNRSFVTDDYDKCLEYIHDNMLPIKIHNYKSGTEIWSSWVIPQKWIVEEAIIKDGDEVILNYDDHPLHLIAYSGSYCGQIRTEDLKNHIYTHAALPDAIPWHFRQNYRPWENAWGFCASQNFVDSLKKDSYYVSLKTRREDGIMKVGEYHIEGSQKETIVLVAHLCHSGMANDDLAGVSAGLEVMKRLKEKENSLKYSYKLLIVQEMLGTAAYLESRLKHNIKYGIFMEMPANDNRMALQESFNGDSKIDRVAKHQLKRRYKDAEVFKFRDLIQNDEMILESPGYEIPTISLSRYPYDEYHTQFDNMDIINESYLIDYVEYVMDILMVFEKDFVPKRKFDGLISLANPKYDLYIDPGQPAFSGVDYDISLNLVRFRDYVFRMLDGNYSVFDIAEKFELEFDFVYDYLNKFYEKNLINKLEK